MIIVYILAGLWSIGCACLPLWGAKHLLFDDDDFPLGLAVLLIGFPLGCLGAVVPWVFIAESQSADLATLKKNEWVCSASHVTPVTTYIKSGNVMIPMTSYQRVCDQYNRKP